MPDSDSVAGTTGGSPPLILLVEDEPTLARAVRFNLEREGYRVLWAADGAAALKQFQRDKVGLVLLDIMLPGLSGLDVCRAIRRESAVPIMMLTAKTTETDKVVGLELGADDYLTKPFGMRELIARVRALMRRASAQPLETNSGSIVVEHVTIHPRERRVRKDGREVELRPREFDLFLFLARNRGQVFTRDQLLEHVWGFDFEGESRTVDVHVRLLREKLEKDPSQPALIRTVRRIGYSLT
jgi:DNA-binding response OmpR family regulator